MRNRISLTVLCVIAASVIAVFWGDDWLGEKKTEALLRGDDTVQLESFSIHYHQCRVECSDPEVLRYFESCFRENDPEGMGVGTTFELQLRFVGGGSLTARIEWIDARGFSLCMPGDRPLGDGGEPRCGIVLKHPVPKSVKELIDFLNDESGKTAGAVLILEPGTARRERDPSLLW